MEEHIEAYRSKLVHQPPPPEPDPIPNFFEDMEPTIKKQKKILIGTDNNTNTYGSAFSRLEAVSDIPISADLEDWEENEQCGWDEINDSNTKLLIRDKRREMRAQRQQQKLKTGPPSHRN